jgi:O-acetylhomoserine (thiol)-lyase
MAVQSRHPETTALHTGWRRDEFSRAVSVPIFQSSAYEFDNVKHADDVFRLKVVGNTYSRIMNPTCDIFEQRVAAMEGGVAALAVSSGQAAISLAVLNLAQAGDNIVSSTDLYGGTWNLFANTFRRMNVEVRFADPEDPSAFARATDRNTRCYFGETLPNPKLKTFPIEEIVRIGQEHHIPVIIDNTLVPLVCRPRDYGAAVIVHSATKYIGGHGTTLGGVIVDTGQFDWAAAEGRIPLMTLPDSAHDYVVWPEVCRHLKSSLGRSPYILKARMTLLRDLGPCLSPMSAFLLLQGLETLSLRMTAHCENAFAVAKMLAADARVESVTYPGIASGLPRERAEKYLTSGYGPLVQFEVVGGYAAGCRFIESLQMFYHVANIGDARSLALHPASTTHAQLPVQSRRAAGVNDGTIRLSVGLEHIDDILNDLRQALDRSSAIRRVQPAELAQAS